MKPLGMENMYRLPTAIWMSRTPPRFRLEKNTLSTAYAIRMMQKMSITGLGLSPQTPEAAMSVREAFSMSCSMAAPSSPIPEPDPVRPAAKVP